MSYYDDLLAKHARLKPFHDEHLERVRAIQSGLRVSAETCADIMASENPSKLIASILMKAVQEERDRWTAVWTAKPL